MNTIVESQPPAGMSIDVEDWFMANNLTSATDSSSWDLQESRIEQNIDCMLHCLSEYEMVATFFVLGWIAKRFPVLVDRIHRAGHEIGAHGMNHEPIHSLSPSHFRDDVAICKDILEQRTGQAVHGYRAPDFSITEWAVDVLQEVGYSYDSSAVPILVRNRYGVIANMDAREPVREIRPGFYEVCVSCVPIGRRGLPWGGGGWFRLLPYSIFRRGVAMILNAGRPFVFYIHPWELDPGQPRVEAVTRMQSFRHTVNLDRCEARWRRLLVDFQWTSLSDIVASCAAVPTGH